MKKHRHIRPKLGENGAYLSIIQSSKGPDLECMLLAPNRKKLSSIIYTKSCSGSNG